MKMKKPRLLLVVLLGLSWVLPADATDDEAAYLPLAVGNSWTYGHDYYDLNNEQDFFELYPAYFEAPRDESTQLPKFTITVRSTEVIDGKTYYVLSDMPANWPPPPPVLHRRQEATLGRYAPDGTHRRWRAVCVSL